jgi:hypothetical protein
VLVAIFKPPILRLKQFLTWNLVAGWVWLALRIIDVLCNSGVRSLYMSTSRRSQKFESNSYAIRSWERNRRGRLGSGATCDGDLSALHLKDCKLDVKNTSMGLTNIELCAGVFLSIMKSNDLESKEIVSIGNTGGNSDALNTTIGNLLPY